MKKLALIIGLLLLSAIILGCGVNSGKPPQSLPDAPQPNSPVGGGCGVSNSPLITSPATHTTNPNYAL